MALFEWNDSYSVQVASIDEQHLALMNMINALHEAMGKRKSHVVMAALLEELGRYTREHFSFEESKMQEAGYPGLEEHRIAHHALIERVTEFQTAYEGNSTGLSLEIMEFLKDWLQIHILDEDQQYSACLKEAGIR